jgi:erythromycin esterase
MIFQQFYKRFTGLLLLALCKLSFVYSQANMERYVKDSVVQVRSIDPGDTLFSDLDLLGKAIGDSKIVMLGEQDHGDSRTFLAKCRIIKYLHEKLGFNVLAFESDFYALNKVWDSISLNPSQVESTIMNNIFKVWTLCEQFKPVIKYLTDQYQGNNRLQLTGFDNQMVGEYSVANLGSNLIKYITGKGISFSKDEKNMNRLKNTLKSVHTFFYSGKYIKSDSSMQMFSDIGTLADLIIQQLSLDAENLNSFEMQTLSSLKAISDQMIYALNKDYFLADSIRDKQMASNLRWLCTYKYPNQKIIVWAANSHIVKSDSRLLKKKFAKPSSMGYLFSSDPIMQDKTYIIGFTGLQGETGRITSSRKYSIPKPEKDGLESWLANKKVIYGFVNFKAFRKRNLADNESFNMRYTNWISVKLPWHNICDGIFYISDMTACQ